MMLMLKGSFPDWPQVSQALLDRDLETVITEIPPIARCFIWAETWGLFELGNRQTLVVEAKRGLFRSDQTVNSLISSFEGRNHYFRSLVSPSIDLTYRLAYRQHMRRQPYFPLNGAVGLIPLGGGRGNITAAINPKFYERLTLVASSGLRFVHQVPKRELIYVPRHPLTNQALQNDLDKIVWLSALIPILTANITSYLGESAATTGEHDELRNQDMITRLIRNFLDSRLPGFLNELKEDGFDELDLTTIKEEFTTVVIPEQHFSVVDSEWPEILESDLTEFLKALTARQIGLPPDLFERHGMWWRHLPKK